MNNFVKMCVNVDIDEAIEALKQMQGCIQDGDTSGAEHFLDRARDSLGQVEDGLFEAGFHRAKV